ncbi:MAG: hypothetical protein MUP90_10760 [Gammaproteobacteria bacterium]|nr:hypothetical protein [Gammaproteobacteria bacterium]
MTSLRKKTGLLFLILLILPLSGGAVLADQLEIANDVAEARTLPPDSEETVVPLDQEPRHRLAYEGGEFQVLDIQLHPGEVTLYHLHNAPMFYVSVSASTTDVQVLGGQWLGARVFEEPDWLPGEVDTNIGYAEKPLAHRVKNVGSSLFRLIGVVNKRARPESDAHDDGLPGALEIQNAWFQQSRTRVAPGESAFLQSLGHPVVVVQTSPGSARIRLAGREDTGMHSPGDFVVVKSGQELELVNGGDTELSLVFIAVH